MNGRSHSCTAFAAVALVTTLAACGGGSNTAESAVRDSAGVRIVENRWADSTAIPVCAVEPEASLDIGTVAGDPAYQLYRVFDALRLSDGRMAVVNQGSSEVRFYDVRGRYTGSVGREGDGPGEFRGAQAVWQDNDSLVVWDDELQRFSVFLLDGTFVRSFQIAPVLMNAPQVLGFVGAEAHVAYHHVEFDPPGLAPQWLDHMRYTRAGAVIDTVGRHPYGTYGPIGRPEDHMAGRTLFEARTVMTTSTEHVVLSQGDEPEFRVLDGDGRLVAIVRWPEGDRVVRQADVDRFREERLAESDDPTWRRLILISIDEVPVSDRFPAVRDLEVDDAGRVWVQRYPRPGAGPVRHWLVFGSDGRIVCRVEMRTGFALARIQAGMLIGIERDETDVEHVRAYRISDPVSPGANLP